MHMASLQADCHSVTAATLRARMYYSSYLPIGPENPYISL